MSDEQIKRTLLQQFGAPLFAYVSNLEVDDVPRSLEHPHALATGTRRALDQLVEFLLRMRVQAGYQGLPPEVVIGWAAEAQSPRTHIFNEWRQQAGGDFPELDSTDPVFMALAEMATYIFPALLLRSHLSRRDYSPLGLTIHPPFRHPAIDAFERAWFNDEALRKLFPNRTEDATSTLAVTATSTGSAGSMQLAVLPSALLGSAYLLARMRDQLDLGLLHNAIAEVLTIVRSALTGYDTRVPAWIGFNNVALASSGSIAFPWGSVRKAGSSSLELLPPEVRPSASADDDIRGFVLEVPYRYSVHVAAPEPDSDLPPHPVSSEAALASLNQCAEYTALSIALGVERKPAASCCRAWTVILDPLSHGLRIAHGMAGTPSAESHRLDPNEEHAVLEWAQRLSSVSSNKIGIARRRILSALCSRMDPGDAFLDAVIALENLFGGGLSFRVTSAMAILLEKEEGRRYELHKRVSKAYGLRNKLVHGGEELGVRRLVEARDQAVEWVLNALRRLYADQPALIDDDDRARRIILSL